MYWNLVAHQEEGQAEEQIVHYFDSCWTPSNADSVSVRFIVFEYSYSNSFDSFIVNIFNKRVVLYTLKYIDNGSFPDRLSVFMNH